METKQPYTLRRQMRGFSEELTLTPKKNNLVPVLSGELHASPIDLSRPSNFEGFSGIKPEKD